MKLRYISSPFLAYLLLTWIFHVIYSPFFEASGAAGNGIGHDYSLALPSLLDGRYWFIANGILPAPWFTPAFCAGQPFFADPQSIFYSPIQFLSFFVQPLAASYLSLILFAGAGYWGMYLFCKRSVRLETAPSILAASLWMFNGFSVHHHLVGHIGFLPFFFAPMVAWLLAPEEQRPWHDNAVRVGLSALLIAGCLHAGLGSLMIPFGLCVWGLACLAIIRGAPWRQFYTRASVTVILAFGISASKIVAASALMKNFPRAQYPLPGISSFIDLLNFVAASLFRPEEENFVAKASILINRAVSIGPHELAFDLTLVPVVIFGAGLLLVASCYKPKNTLFSADKITHLVLFSVLTAVPFSLMYYTPEWNAILKQLPIIQSTSAPWRWLVELSPFVCVISTMVLSLALHHRQKLIVLVAISAIGSLVTIKASTSRDFYEAQSYDPSPILAAYKKSEKPEFSPKISAIGAYRTDDGEITFTPHQNDLIAMGVSQAFCYNPLFGYNIENLDIRTLHPGNPLNGRDGVLNVKNPACYVFPFENNCEPGDHFKDDSESKKKAELFINYAPWDFATSSQQELANLASSISFLLALALIASKIWLKKKYRSS